LPLIYNGANDRCTQQHNKQIISNLHFVSASGNDRRKRSRPKLRLIIHNNGLVQNHIKGIKISSEEKVAGYNGGIRRIIAIFDVSDIRINMGKTITTYLIDGNPQGTQSVFISNKICKMLVIPRAALSIINEREELHSPAFYILLGEDDGITSKAYLGETENFRERIKNHEYNKAFWQKTLVFISKDGAMTKADVQYLEYLAVKTANKAKRFDLCDNKQIPKEPNLPEHQKDSMNEFFDDIRLLTSFIGCPIFDVIDPRDRHIFFSKSKGANIRGFYDENGFTVLKGSTLAKGSAPLFKMKEKRDDFIKKYTAPQDGNIVLETDYTFNSPSMAASICLGRHTNGWNEWKDKSGQTLDEVYRKKLE
jgi:predicted GIY-YIG superfamily endonuclease